MKNIKYIAGVIIALIGIVFAYFNFVVNTTNANPDYICVKNVERTCKIEKCDAWNIETGKRMCYGERATTVGYYHIRTTCENGYSSIRGVDDSSAQGTINDIKSKYSKNDAKTAAEEDNIKSKYDKEINNTGNTSGRHSDDFVYSNENCQVEEVDETKPEGEVEQVN